MYDENEIKKITFDFSKIEENPIFNEVIIGNENSQIAELIKQLDNSNWVKVGKEYLTEPQWGNEVCPFCQQNTISKELYNEIQNYFDENYQNKMRNLWFLQDQYHTELENVESIKASLLDNEFIQWKEEILKTITTLFQSLNTKLTSNYQKINKKIQNPNIMIELESTTSEKDEINNFLDSIITEIKEYNDKVKNKKDTKKKIIDNFWNIMRWNYDSYIVDYQKQKKEISSKKSKIEESIVELKKNINNLQKEIKKAEADQVNIKDAIDNINNQLMFFWLEGFSIVSSGNEEYKLQRPHQDLAKFETLSEGEKTVISFLYFLELCKGRQSKDEVKGKEIIVIDDPISSLSHMYVFNIAQLIKQNFFNQKDKYEQIFILTHNLYFFHELLFKQKKKDLKLFRIVKSDFSNVIDMDHDEIQNEYQSYWTIIKDFQKGKATPVAMANAMRNILEHFFWFIEKNDFNELTKKLEQDEKNIFFIRYINRESHSDSTNISDFKEIDPQVFKNAFKQIFQDFWYIEHYNTMIT